MWTIFWSLLLLATWTVQIWITNSQFLICISLSITHTFWPTISLIYPVNSLSIFNLIMSIEAFLSQAFFFSIVQFSVLFFFYFLFFSFKRFLMLFLFLCVKNLCSIGSWNGSNSHGSRCSVQYFLDGHLIFLRCPINDYILIGYHTLSISRSFLKEQYWLTKFYWAQ